MAKANSTADEALYDGLQQARKKKPRYYCLIAKAADVVGLIVQKKPINDGQVQKAKTESKGTLVIQGVCVGEGVELTFEVLEAEPSIKPLKIKDFIDEQTELALKPKWAVVPAHSAVVDDEAALLAARPAPAAAPPPPPAPPAPPPPPAPPASGVDAKSLHDRLKALLMRQKELLERAPEQRETLLAVSKPVSTLVLQGRPDAPAALDKLEQALNAVERTARAAAPRSAAPAQPAAESAAPLDPWQAARLAAAAELQKVIQLVIATNDPEVGKSELELRAVLRQIGGPMQTQQQAAEMERYLDQDDVVADVCEYAYDLKSPLLAALNEIKSQLAA